MSSTNAHSSESQLSPRLIDGRRNFEISRGRMLPLTVNPRDGWKAGLKGAFNTALAQELMTKEALAKTMLRSRDGLYLNTGVTDTPTGKLGDFRLPESYYNFPVQQQALEWSDDEQGGEEPADYAAREDKDADNISFASSHSGASSALSVGSHKSAALAAPSALSNKIPVNSSQRQITAVALVSTPSSSVMLSEPAPVFSDDEAEEEDNSVVTEQDEAVLERVPIEEMRKQLNECIEDDILVDCRSVIMNLGQANKRQLHNLTLRSAYEFYCSGGEPSFTASRPADFGANACEVPFFYLLLFSNSAFVLLYYIWLMV